MSMLTYEQLRSAVAGDFVALRSTVALQPAAGAAGKVMPPTYGVPDSAPTRYAIEERRVDTERSRAVLLDSVASQANRMELALLEGWEVGELAFPVAYVDFTDDGDLADLGRLTVLEAPHRIADAIFRDSLLDGTLFRLSDVGRSITDARPAAATALLRFSPSALLFGMWDSTGPKGGLGSKFQRAIVSEIVGFDVEPGVNVGSRIDPLGIEKDSAELYQHSDPSQTWTLEAAEATKDEKGKPKKLGKDTKAGKPSSANHGNVTPSIDARAGGVTISRAVQTTVLSLAALRRLRFPINSSGVRVPLERRRDAETEARSVIAALGVAAIAYQHDLDYDLRSRCLLVPEHPVRLELLTRDGSEPTPFSVDRATAAAILRDATAAAERAGMGFHHDEVRLTPAPKLIELLKRSRDLTRRTTPSDADGET